MLQVSKIIGTGLAILGLAGVGVGIGIVFGVLSMSVLSIGVLSIGVLSMGIGVLSIGVFLLISKLDINSIKRLLDNVVKSRVMLYKTFLINEGTIYNYFNTIFLVIILSILLLQLALSLLGLDLSKGFIILFLYNLLVMVPIIIFSDRKYLKDRIVNAIWFFINIFILVFIISVIYYISNILLFFFFNNKHITFNSILYNTGWYLGIFLKLILLINIIRLVLNSRDFPTFLKGLLSIIISLSILIFVWLLLFTIIDSATNLIISVGIPLGNSILHMDSGETKSGGSGSSQGGSGNFYGDPGDPEGPKGPKGPKWPKVSKFAKLQGKPIISKNELIAKFSKGNNSDTKEVGTIYSENYNESDWLSALNKLVKRANLPNNEYWNKNIFYKSTTNSMDNFNPDEENAIITAVNHNQCDEEYFIKKGTVAEQEQTGQNSQDRNIMSPSAIKAVWGYLLVLKSWENHPGQTHYQSCNQTPANVFLIKEALIKKLEHSKGSIDSTSLSSLIREDVKKNINISSESSGDNKK